MSAPRGFQKGSFRGAPFVAEGHEAGGGRRGVQHELPQGEAPIWEDLGRRARRFSVDAHIRGTSYPEGATTLADALDQKGPGTLIHPWLGTLQVAAESYTRVDRVEDGAMASFAIVFVETGLAAPPPPARDTAAQSRAEAAAARKKAPSTFAKRFSLDRATAFVSDASDKLAKAAALATTVSGGLLGGAGSGLRALDQLAGAVGLGPRLQGVLTFAQATIEHVSVLSAIGRGHPNRLPAIGGLLSWGASLPPVVGDTPARLQERGNQAAIVQLVNVASAIALTEAVADIGFASYEEAIDVRDRYASIFDQLALRQADAGDDEGAAVYDDLRRAVVADVTARGGSLARLQVYSPATTEPALVIAYRLYGDPASLVDQSQEIVARNRVIHPGFVPGGRPLQVITPAHLMSDV